MLGVNESRRRDKQDTMMTFIILKLLYESINKEEIRERAEDYLILGRIKLVDQALYEMAKNRRNKKECPSTPPEKEEGNPPATGEQEQPPPAQPPAAPNPNPPKPARRATQ